MKYFQRLRSYPEFISGQAVETRAEVEEIRNCLNMISHQLQETLSEEQRLAQNIKKVQTAQTSFRNRVESVSQSLATYKTRLASFHS